VQGLVWQHVFDMMALLEGARRGVAPFGLTD
jgi:hypothetical protein